MNEEITELIDTWTRRLESIGVKTPKFIATMIIADSLKTVSNMGVELTSQLTKECKAMQSAIGSMGK